MNGYDLPEFFPDHVFESIPFEDESWRIVRDYPAYQVSNDGRVRQKNGRLLKLQLNHGYHCVHLSKNGKAKRQYCFRMVAEAFLPRVVGKTVVDHLDENKLNDCVENLEWVTRSENAKRAKERKERKKQLILDLCTN